MSQHNSSMWRKVLCCIIKCNQPILDLHEAWCNAAGL